MDELKKRQLQAVKLMAQSKEPSMWKRAKLIGKKVGLTPSYVRSLYACVGRG
jgi:hypothetical protein